MSKGALYGIVPALSTICKKNGEIDEEGQRSLVSFNIESGVQGLIPLVMNGDFYKFSDEERKRITDIVVDEANGRIPVFVGTSHSGTTPTIELSKYAQDAGADGVVIIPPYFYEKESRLALYDHYLSVARAIDIPIMIQEVEETTGVPFSSSLITKLHEADDNIKYLKTEGATAISKIEEVLEATGGKMGMFGGYFGFSLIEELKAGAVGTVPGRSVPEACLGAYTEYQKGRQEAARKTLERYMPLLEFTLLNILSFPQIDIEVLKIRGIINSTFTRQPRVPLPESAVSRLRQLVKLVGVEA